MKILINMGTLKRGGGQNVGLNFLQGIVDLKDHKNEYFFLVVKNSDIYHWLKSRNIENIITTNYSPVRRIFNELFTFSTLLKKLEIDIIYTYFGYGAFINDIPQVCGVAFSNIFFPEISFWEGGILKKVFRGLIDRFRIFGIKNASALIFENKTMERRCHSLFKMSPENTTYISPSFNPNFLSDKIEIPKINQHTKKLLMLCGWQRNKNIMKVPEIAFHLKKSQQDFHFLITAPADDSEDYREFLRSVEKFDVENMISLIGPVKKSQLKSLYEQIDFVLLMSKLESFSNNIIEAWYFEKPLILSKFQWAKDLCQKGVLYIERDSPTKIAMALSELATSENKQMEIIQNGKTMLKRYPTYIQKTREEIEFVEKIYNESEN